MFVVSIYLLTKLINELIKTKIYLKIFFILLVKMGTIKIYNCVFIFKI